MDREFWSGLYYCVSLLWIPIGLMATLYMKYNDRRHVTDDVQKKQAEQFESRLTIVEQQTKFNDLQIGSMRDTLKETKESIKEVKQGVDKLIDKLIK